VSEGFEQLATDKPKASSWREQPDSPDDRLDFEMFSERRVEMEWLAERILRRRQSAPIVITGLGGVGKTTLLRMFFANYRTGGEPAWLNLEPSPDPMAEASAFVEALYQDRNGTPYVTIDGAEGLSDEQMQALSSRVLNLKRIRAIIFSTRRSPIFPRAEILSLSAMNIAEATELLRRLNPNLSADDLARAAQASAGVPLAVKLIADLIRRYPAERVAHLLRGEIYDLERRGVKLPPKLITEIKPSIVVANEALLEKLKRQPDSIFQLPSRKFEELVAELLDGMGFEVELTKATRDGGKDILAYMNTGIGKFLCLVEAKKYRQDRTVGVELVRTLYGTLCDYQANSAMLVTTSSFSPDARAFQKKHEYQLALQDYGNVVQWIQDYKRG
jgi:restriction system protein